MINKLVYHHDIIAVFFFLFFEQNIAEVSMQVVLDEIYIFWSYKQIRCLIVFHLCVRL